MTGVVHVKDGSTWKAVNFNGAKIWVKHSGTWKEPTGVWVKHSGTWKKVYPSDLEAWTTAYDPSSAYTPGPTSLPYTSTTFPYTYTSITVPGRDVRWEGQTATNQGQKVQGYDYGWTPVTSAGFEYGAVTRVEIAFEAQALQTATGSDWYRMRARPNAGGGANATSNLTTVNTVYTFDYTVAAWSITDANAGKLHTTPNLTNSIMLAGYFNNALSGASDQVAVGEMACRIKYKYN